MSPEVSHNKASSCEMDHNHATARLPQQLPDQQRQRPTVWTLVAFAAALVVPVAFGGIPSAVAQLQVELRSGVTVGSHTGSAAALDIAPNVSFDLTVRRQMTNRFALFGGFVRTAFGCEEGYCLNREITVVGQHAALGAEWGRGGPWVRGGVLVGTTTVGSEGADAEIGVGFLGAAGLSVGSGNFRFLPGISYRWMGANTTEDADHAVALALDLGFAWNFGPRLVSASSRQ